MKNKKITIKYLPFIGLVLLIAGFSLYGIFNATVSLGNYTKDLNASVVGAVDATSETVGTPVTNTEKLIFSDVPEAHENATAISYFKNMGYVGGYDDGTFKPVNLVSRAEFLKILLEVVDADFAGGVYEKCFTDVQSGWFEVYVCYASKSGLVGGYDDGYFRPERTVSRVEAIKMTLNALGVKMPTSVDAQPFLDVAVNDWYAPYAKVSKDLGVVKGRVFLPNLSLTRASTVQLIYDILSATKKI